MKLNPTARIQKTNVLKLLICLFAFSGTAYQAVMAHRLAAMTIQAYAPMVEKQAVALIVDALPKNDQGSKAASLAQALATSVEGQYTALSRAVESQASALTNQALGWAAVSIVALFAVFETRRKVPSAA
jgi:hypothetical protein